VDTGVYAADQLFATLDPTLRRLDLKGEGAVVIADTVGFISNLPHDLVAAFKSTLQETVEASLLLHVVDAASHQRARCIAEVNEVLQEIGADQVHQLEIYNKIDLMEDVAPRIERNEEGQVTRVWLSAQTGEGIDLLLLALQEFFKRTHVRQRLRLGAANGRWHALLHRRGEVLHEVGTDEGGWEMEVDLPEREFQRLLKEEPDLKACFL
jgi:GTP-binding protein HflX